MDLDNVRRRARRAYLYVGVLVTLSLILTVLQYQWAGEVSQAEGSRIRSALNAGLQRVARDFNQELQSGIGDLLIREGTTVETERIALYEERMGRFRDAHPDVDPFRRYGLVLPRGTDALLLLLDPASAKLREAAWPPEWQGFRDQTLMRLSGTGFGPPPASSNPLLLEVPRFAMQQPEGGPRGRMGEREWLVVEANPAYFADVLIPRLLAIHLGANGKLDYKAEVVIPPEEGAIREPDAVLRIFDTEFSDILRRAGLDGYGGRRGGPPFGRPPGFQKGGGFRGGGTPPTSDRGMWQLRVQHESGSLESIVNRNRWRNVGVSGAILGLILATVFALVRFSRRAEELALVQMNFVAGVSHELRTPLTVIRTAAFNLRGRISAKPEQVEKYGKLIQEESEKLTVMVEQVLRFASSNSGTVVHRKEPVPVAGLIAALSLPPGNLTIETNIAAGISPMLADEQAIRQVVQNLVDNAAKYGTETSKWIGITAREADGHIVIEVADHGPGIPESEQKQIFDPFFRGERALSDQIHGTGLGLNLAKKIVEAHGGKISVQSKPGEGTAFTVSLPAAPTEMQDDFAHTAG